MKTLYWIAVIAVSIAVNVATKNLLATAIVVAAGFAGLALFRKEGDQ